MGIDTTEYLKKRGNITERTKWAASSAGNAYAVIEGRFSNELDAELQ